MAEQILPPHWAAMLERSMSPERQRELTLAAMLQEGFPPMPPTLSGVENQEPPAPPIPHRAIGRMLTQTGGAIAGGAGGGLVGGPPGAIAGGAAGSAGAGQLYDAAADWMMGTQERPPIMSGQTALDAAAGAIPAAGPVIGAGMRAAGRAGAEVGRAAMSRPTMASALASGALGGAALTSTSGGTQQPVEIPAEFRPMDRDEFFRKNRRAARSLSDAQTEARNSVMQNPAYQGLIDDGRRTQAKKMMDEALANAERAYNKDKADNSGEDDRLSGDYDKYKAGLKADLEEHFAAGAREEQAAKDRLANTPFRQRYSGWAAALPAAGFAIAAGVPFAGRLSSNLMDQTASRVGAATQRARTTTDPREFQVAVDELNTALASRPPRVLDQQNLGDAARVAGQAAWPAAKAGLAGGPVVAEMSMFPDQWDAINLPAGPAQEKARAAALNLGAYGERALLGGAAAAGGYKLPDVLPWPRRPNWAQAGAATRLAPPGGGGQGGGGGGGNRGGGGQGGGGPNPPIPPPSAGGPPHAPGVTTYRNPSTGEVRSLDAHGRWRGPTGNGRQGWTREPPASWQRMSEAQPSSMADYLMTG